MRKIDFDQLGGLPLKQPTLGYMQKAYDETQRAWIDWVTKTGIYRDQQGENAHILVGVEQKMDGGVEVLTPGWIVRSGELLRFAGCPLEAVTQGNGIGTQTLTSTATFKDGTVRDIYHQKIAVPGGDAPLQLASYRRAVNLEDLRPVLARTLRYDVPAIAPGALGTVIFNVGQAEVGDVVAVSVTEVVENGYSSLYGIPVWVVVQARINTAGQVVVSLLNQHPTQPAFGGWAEFRFRILK